MSRLISTHRQLCISKQFSAVADFRAIELQFPSRGRCFRFRNDGSIFISLYSIQMPTALRALGGGGGGGGGTPI